ncbi:MAG: peptide deformylase [Clostridia bacterium]|nr:peptide deformylase [Clostridia bacterium]
MALRNIVKEGDSVLRKKCRPVVKFDDRLAGILDDMRDTMYQAQGVGLAAPQVGILRRMVVIDCSMDKTEYIELINPEIIATEGEQEGTEGCLSVPGVVGWVKRPMKVTVRAQDRFGEFFEVTGEELLARAFCHELAHLDGELFIDVMEYEVEPEDEEDEE